VKQTPNLYEQVEQDEASTVRESNYSLPFFWAPFVLIGNYQ